MAILWKGQPELHARIGHWHDSPCVLPGIWQQVTISHDKRADPPRWLRVWHGCSAPRLSPGCDADRRVCAGVFSSLLSTVICAAATAPQPPARLQRWPLAFAPMSVRMPARERSRRKRKGNWAAVMMTARGARGLQMPGDATERASSPKKPCKCLAGWLAGWLA